MPLLAFAAGPSWPFLVLAIGVFFIVFAIVVLRLHAFLALILAAFLTGLLAGQLPGEPDKSHWVQAIELSVESFGKAAGSIGVVIALASIIGLCLMESGAADKIVRRLISFFGENLAGLALLASGFFLSVPVFFDTVFFLLIPLARAMSLRSGRNFMLYVMAMAGGGAITHSIVPPTPGPLLVSGMLHIDLGITMIAGVLAGILPAVAVWFTAKWLDRTMPIPVREVAGASMSDLNAIITKPDAELPSFGWAIMPVILPAVLIAIASVFDMAATKLPGVVGAFGGPARFGEWQACFDFVGNKNVALLLGALISMGLYWRQSRLSLAQLSERLAPAFESAGVIILITSAGGAFGAMIRYAGVGDAIKGAAAGYAINYILLAWVVTAVIRVAQGSATVAMITASALMSTVVEDKSLLPYHPVYLYLVIGFGSMILSWMNDSGFWIVAKLSGFTEKETLKSWTILVSVISVLGLIETLICASIFPLK